MTEADIQIIVQEVMRRMFNEPGVMNAIAGANGLPTRDTSTLDKSARQTSSMAASTADATISTVVTRNDIVEFAKAGKKRLEIGRASCRERV